MRINYRTLRRITFSVYILITISFCTILIILGKKEISKAKNYAVIERSYIESLLSCRNSLNLLIEEYSSIIVKQDTDACIRLNSRILEFQKSLNILSEFEKERSVQPRISTSEFFDDVGLLMSAAEALKEDIKVTSSERQLYDEDISAIGGTIQNVQVKLQQLMKIEMDHAEIWEKQSFYFFNSLQYLLILFFVLTAVFSIVASILFSNILGKSLKELSNGTKEISSGNLKYRFENIQSDELGSVMHDFNLMSRRLEQQTLVLKKINEELEENATQLIEANKHKDRFLANMSHELRTPLNSIIGFSELIIKKSQSASGESNEKIHGHSRKILIAAEHLLDLISGLLEIAKLDAGVLKPQLLDIDISACAEEIVHMLKPLAEQKHLELKTEMEANLILKTDPRHIKQIFINLINNAIKFTHQGHITVSARKVGGNKPMVELSVADTGIGISEAEQKNIFKDFHRVETGLTSNYEGVGLGLTLTKRLVELHNGEIKVQSEPEKGSTFIVKLPMDNV